MGNVLYTSYDTACETAFHAVEPCLDKGDMLFVIDSNYYAGEFHKGTPQRPDGVNLLSSTVATYGSPATHESGNIYTIKKIYKEVRRNRHLIPRTFFASSLTRTFR